MGMEARGVSEAAFILVASWELRLSCIWNLKILKDIGWTQQTKREECWTSLLGHGAGDLTHSSSRFRWISAKFKYFKLGHLCFQQPLHFPMVFLWFSHRNSGFSSGLLQLGEWSSRQEEIPRPRGWDPLGSGHACHGCHGDESIFIGISHIFIAIYMYIYIQIYTDIWYMDSHEMGWMTIHHILSIYYPYTIHILSIYYPYTIHIHPYTDTIPKNNLWS